MTPGEVTSCAFCAGRRLASRFTFDAPPVGEVGFPSGQGRRYHREVWCCAGCGHFYSVHELPMEELYAGEYVSATYGADGLRRRFEQVTALPAEQSDNARRVARVMSFVTAWREARGQVAAPRVLDVGSGLCVFLHRLKAAGWVGLALDPDERAVQHARGVAGVEAIHADFMREPPCGSFDLVTLNRVLEHVTDPIGMLTRARALLAPQGLVYVEVPDGEAAALAGPDREEFFIDHHHVFSAASLALAAGHARARLELLQRTSEPSGKYTLYAFLSTREGT